MNAVDPLCAACRGACCEFMVLTMTGSPQGQYWAYLHATGMHHDGMILEVPCRMLRDGQCQIYDVRPEACRKMVVGAADCQFARAWRRRE